MSPAFTLLELLVVLVIVAALTGLALPRLSGSAARYRADQAAARLANDLRLVREAARTTGTTQRLTLASNTATYAATIPAPDGRAGVLRVDLAADPYRAVVRRTDFLGSPVAEFNPVGTPANPGWVLLVSGSEGRVITLSAAGAVATRRATASELAAGTVTLTVDSRRLNVTLAPTGTGTGTGTGTSTGTTGGGLIQTIVDPVADLLGI